MQHFKFLPRIDADKYTDYYLNKFLIERDFYNRVSQTTYLGFDLPELNLGITKDLNNELMSRFNFPSIHYALVFRHSKPQPIHVDGGHGDVRYASLNLPLIGYENTKMIFYKSKIKAKDIKPSDAYYFPKDSVEYDSELLGSNNWVLINTAIPHNIIDSNPENPRITICFRFKGNPLYEHLYNLIES